MNNSRRVDVLLGLALVVLVAVVGLWPSSASAHTGVQSYLYLDITDDELGGRVELPFGDLRELFGYSLEGEDDEVLAEIEANAVEVNEYIRSHMAVGSAGQDWTYDFTGVDLLWGEGGYAIYYFLADVPEVSVPRELDIRFDPFFDEIDDRDALLLIANDWKGGVIANGEEALLTFDLDNRERAVDLGSPSQWNNFTASVGAGIDHIKTGPDHILFVLVLLLPSVLVFTSAWQPAATFGSSLWRILKIVTMFTVAHSITFVLAGLEILPLPSSRLVESVIAASIALTALHNIWPVFRNREWSLAFVFGLFHGMGFASLVGGLDLDKGTRMLSLLGRNVGIEIGQAVVVLSVFPALFLLRRVRFYRPMMILGSVLLAIVSVGWMFERLFDLDLQISKLVDPVVEVPRAFVLMLVVTVVAAMIYRTERAGGRLLPVAGSDAGAGEADLGSVAVS